MGTTCCCLGTASVYFRSCLGEPLSLLSLWCCVQSNLYSILRRWEGQVRGLKQWKAGQTTLLVCSAVYCMADSVFQELCPTAGCQTYIHFCPVSEAISSPYVTVNAYRDTAPCLRLQICAVEEEEAICLLVMCSKLGFYFTPAGICSHLPLVGQILRCVEDESLANSLKDSLLLPCISPDLDSVNMCKWMTHHVGLLPPRKKVVVEMAIFGIRGWC